MRPRHCTRLAPLLVLAALLAGLATALTPAPALTLGTTKTWIGAGNTILWGDGANWVGGVAPVQFDDLVFPILAGHLTNTNDLPPGTVFNSITFQGFNYVLNGDAVTIGTGITASHPTGTSNIINLPVASTNTTINVTETGARLVFGGSVNDMRAPNKNGAGTAILLAPGTAPAGWSVFGGILDVQNGAAMGGNGRIDPGATLQVQGGITLPNFILLSGGIGAANATGAVESVSGNNTLTGGMQVFANSTISADAGSTLTMSGNPVSLGTFTLTANVAGTAAIASSIQDTGGLTKTGTGGLTLSGANTYTGPTTVNAGTLLVNGNQPSSSVTVASGATLGGTGTTGPVTVNGIVNPGVGGPGILHSGNATFNGGSTFAVDLNGTTVGSGYDALAAAGTVTLAAPTLTVSVGFPSATGNVFVIIQSTGALSGAFAGLLDGFTFTSGGRTFRINYTANAVTLTDVTPPPTPTSCILGDINCDGIVDIRDYGLWRQNFGQQGAGNPADLDQNGIVDIRDYGIWRQNFGHTAGAAPRTALPAVSPTATATPTPRADRGPVSQESGSPWGAILKAVQALGIAFPNEIMLQVTEVL